MDTISRQDAKKAGLTRYFTGNPCPAGHICERWVGGSSCVECRKLLQKRWREENSDRVEEINKRHAGKKSETRRARYAADPEHELIDSWLWKYNNRGAVNAMWMKRHAAKLRATPAWSDLDVIRQIYQNCPIGYHVDHAVPLQSDLVCGLHVSWNLQYLPIRDNLSKGNRLEY